MPRSFRTAAPAGTSASRCTVARLAASALAALAWIAASPVSAQRPADSAPASGAPASEAPAAPAGGPPAASTPAGPLPGFAELEAAGARIGRIRVVTLNVFDIDDPAEDNWLFRLANRVHVVTQPKVIERALTFREGDPVRVAVIDEAERVLRTFRFLFDVRIRPVAYADGVVDVEVTTRDTWTLDPGIGASRSGGENSGSVSISEGNLLGTGTAIGFGTFRNVDRSGNEFGISNERAFGRSGRSTRAGRAA